MVFYGPLSRYRVNQMYCSVYLCIQASVGSVLEYAIPDNTFHDPEDGDTRNLQLLFQTFDDEHSVVPSSWIQLNRSARTLYGLPLSQVSQDSPSGRSPA